MSCPDGCVCLVGYSDCAGFRKWKAKPVGDPKVNVDGLTPFLELRELRHAVYTEYVRGSTVAATGLRRADQFAVTSSVSIPEGEVRLERFLAVLRLLGTAPWSSSLFRINEDILRRMVGSHMTLIVGAAYMSPKLYAILSQYEDLSGSQNLVWVSQSRQLLPHPHCSRPPRSPIASRGKPQRSAGSPRLLA